MIKNIYYTYYFIKIFSSKFVFNTYKKFIKLFSYKLFLILIIL